jgi:GT2 family glycosyltransferase
MTPAITAIVPTHNRAVSLRATLTSLLAQGPSQGYEILVVDNACTDRTAAVVEEVNRSATGTIRYIREDLLGLHYARNAGARAARAPILAFTDDDAVCSPDWLRHLLAAFADPRVGCVGGKILPRWEVDPPRWILRYPGALSLLDLGDAPRELASPQDIYGCNFSIRRDLLYSLGGFNPDSFGPRWIGDGETGLLRKVYRAGWKVLYHPGAVVWHQVPAARLTLDYMQRRFANQGSADAYSLLRKRPGPLSALARAGFYGSGALAFAFVGMGLRLVPGEARFHNALRQAYCRARSAYEFRFAFDPNLRAWVARDDWLTP